jgi:hypothetical protein
MKMFDVEEQILKCWEINEDLTLIAEAYEHNDDICNKVLGLKHVYEMRFDKLWRNYEDALEEMYKLKEGLKEKENDSE